MLLAENRDKGLHVFFINQVDDPEAKNHRWRQYREVWGYVEGESCRRAAILRPLRRPGGARGRGALLRRLRRAAGDRESPRGRTQAGSRRRAGRGGRRSNEAILQVVREAEPAVGRTRAVEILRGGRSKVVLKYGYDELPGYGDFADWRADDLLREVDALIDGGMLRSTGGRFPKLALTARAA